MLSNPFRQQNRDGEKEQGGYWTGEEKEKEKAMNVLDSSSIICSRFFENSS
jgi:hypothetical protein